MTEVGKISQLLEALDREHDPVSSSSLLEQLVPLVYEELRTLARANRYRWMGAADLGTTSLVHEAYLKIARGSELVGGGRGQFFALASKSMRNILIDNARWHQRQKRKAAGGEVSTENVDLVSAERSDELLDLDDALTRLEERQPELASIVVLRVFGGLSVEESAEALEISPATVKRRWTLARTWLYRELNKPDPGAAQELPR